MVWSIPMPIGRSSCLVGRIVSPVPARASFQLINVYLHMRVGLCVIPQAQGGVSDPDGGSETPFLQGLWYRRPRRVLQPKRDLRQRSRSFRQNHRRNSRQPQSCCCRLRVRWSLSSPRLQAGTKCPPGIRRCWACCTGCREHHRRRSGAPPQLGRVYSCRSVVVAEAAITAARALVPVHVGRIVFLAQALMEPKPPAMVR